MVIDFGLNPKGIWNAWEILLTFLFVAFGFYFLAKYLREKKNGSIASVSLMNIGYAVFFWGTGLNQAMYLLLNIPELWPTVADFVKSGQIDVYVFSPNMIVDINTHVTMLSILLFISVSPLMYALDKFLKNRPDVPVFKLSAIGLFLLLIPQLIICFIINRMMAPEGKDLLYDGCVTCWQNYVMLLVNLTIAIILLILIWNFVIFYIMMAIKAPPKSTIKTKSSLISIGILLMYFGLFGANLLRNQFGWDSYFILLGPILFTISLLILFTGFNMKS